MVIKTNFSVGAVFLSYARQLGRKLPQHASLVRRVWQSHRDDPVQTSRQVVDSISQLATLVRNDELGIVAEALPPELHQLVTQ